MKSTNLAPNHRILIVDDNTSIHADFRKILCPDQSRKTSAKKLGAALFDKPVAEVAERVAFELDSAYQGQEGLEMVKTSLANGLPYAVAFVDVRMPPGWDGIETIARIWEVCPDLQIVVCTAYADYSWEEMRSKVGKPDSLLILKKPFDNIEVQQFAHALTKKWFLNRQSELQLAELAEANQCLKMSEERFSKAFHDSPLASAIQCLPEQRFVDVNQSLADLAGVSREEMIGRTPAELFLWEKPALTNDWYEHVLSKDVVRDREINIRNDASGAREVLISLSPFALGDKPHALLLAQDLTERARLERQLRQAQKMEAIGQLAAGVAHDFNNILTVIQGHAGLMQHICAAEGVQHKSLEEIIRAAGRASGLIRQLLMFSRKQVMKFRYLDLNESLSGAIDMLQRLVGEHVQIEFQASKAMPSIHADGSMLEQIAMNLAVNARDAMPNGGVISIRISLESVKRGPSPTDSESRDGKYVCLSFQDNGTGIDTQFIGKIFEPFFTTKAAGKGTGLGLSTVFGIVRQHQGWVDVESKTGQGTTFRVYFPAAHQSPEKNEQVINNRLLTGSETVLVAEDEDALRDMVVQILRSQGYTVLAANSGRHALDVWEQAGQPVDLLVTDMIMPGGILGAELAARLAERSPTLKVIYTSGYSPGMAGRDLSLMEGRNFLAKPYTVSELARFVRQCLDTPSRQN